MAIKWRWNYGGARISKKRPTKNNMVLVRKEHLLDDLLDLLSSNMPGAVFIGQVFYSGESSFYAINIGWDGFALMSTAQREARARKIISAQYPKSLQRELCFSALETIEESMDGCSSLYHLKKNSKYTSNRKVNVNTLLKHRKAMY